MSRFFNRGFSHVPVDNLGRVEMGLLERHGDTFGSTDLGACPLYRVTAYCNAKQEVINGVPNSEASHTLIVTQMRAWKLIALYSMGISNLPKRTPCCHIQNLYGASPINASSPIPGIPCHLPCFHLLPGAVKAPPHYQHSLASGGFRWATRF